jgi:hypothetical protein
MNGEGMGGGGFVDPTPTREEFASGLFCARQVGDVTHLIFFVDQIEAPELGFGISKRLTRRIVLTNGARDRMIRMLEATRDGATGAILPDRMSAPADCH